jgi:membrane associated rhomboid family serine protease
MAYSKYVDAFRPQSSRRLARVIPLKDLQPRRSTPIVTLALIAANFAVFLYQISLSPRATDAFINHYAVVPYNISLALTGHHVTLADALIPLFTSMFLHAGWLHILGNMWFLWIFGAHVEDRMGSFNYLLFYLICGIGSGIAQTFFSWGSHLPALGASGAIAGVLSAYIVFSPDSRILSLVPLFIIWFMARVPAWIFIGLWFLVQFLSGVSSLGMRSVGGVAWWAHVGGFLIGLALARFFESTQRRPAYS